MDKKEISEIIPYEFNNRNHSEEQINRIANSIKEFGFNQPIVIDESNIVLVGHGRLHAALKLGLKEVPVLIKSDLSETQKKAYRILDNKLQNDSTWSFDNLELELGFLEDNGFELEPWGLDDLRSMFDVDPEIEDDEFNPDDCENEETLIQLGDFIELGEHKLWCIDCREAKPLPQVADCWITDPPYGVSYVGKTKDALTIENDSLEDEGTAELWRGASKYALDNLKEGGGMLRSGPGGTAELHFLARMDRAVGDTPTARLGKR